MRGGPHAALQQALIAVIIGLMAILLCGPAAIVDQIKASEVPQKVVESPGAGAKNTTSPAGKVVGDVVHDAVRMGSMEAKAAVTVPKVNRIDVES